MSNTVTKVVHELAGSFPAKESEVDILKKEVAVQQMEIDELKKTTVKQTDVEELQRPPRFTVGQNPLPCRPHYKAWAHFQQLSKHDECTGQSPNPQIIMRRCCHC
jgi:hypothetical protein